MRFSKPVVIFLLIFITLGFLLTKPARVTFSTLFFIPQVFPQIPVKPLGWFTPEPLVESVEFGKDEKILAKLAKTQSRKKQPAVIVAMGVKTDKAGEEILLNISASLARLGIVALLPISEKVDKGETKLEKPETFIESFKFLADHQQVDKEKISFFGISIGSSVALVAASDRQISDKVHAFISFGGYYKMTDYLASVASQKMIVEDQVLDWKPKEGTVQGVKEAVIEFAPENERGILTKVLLEGSLLTQEEKLNLSKEAQTILEVFELTQPEQISNLLQRVDEKTLSRIKNLSPDEKLENFTARIFILHDLADSAVPFVESRKLAKALKNKVKTTYYESNIFEHVRPKEGLTISAIPELLKLYFFIWRVYFFVS